MATQYRDMGALNGSSSNPQEVVTQRRSQVYQATHIGEQTLPYMNRSFISFTYGGKKIEDFSLIATISGDRMSRLGYASFEDVTTTYDNLDGQFYWATHYTTNQMDFTLSTDGITQTELDNFLHWFRAGIARELILAEHPNRAIMARVQQPPQLDLLPFEYDTEMNISNVSYPVKTTLYKGDISLSLIMDDPHWYAINNVLGRKITISGREVYEDVWKDVTTGNWVNIFASQDALKVLQEDGIPLGSMIQDNMLLGNGAYANVTHNDASKVWSKAESDANFANGVGARTNGTTTSSQIITIGSSSFTIPAGTYTGYIAGAIVDAGDNGIITLGAGTPGYFFYAGTAPAYTTISFELTPILSDSFIISPKNDHTSGSGNKYNTITIESLNKQELYFTTPNLLTSYNAAVHIFNTLLGDAHYSYEDVRENLRNDVRHPRVRAWAMRVIDAFEKDSIAINASGIKNTAKVNMSYFLTDASHNVQSMKFSFNSQTGEAIGRMHCRIASTSVPHANEFNTYQSAYLTSEIVENVGDMLRSNYIIIQDRNYPTASGEIHKWESTTDITKQYSHRIMHDVSGGLSNLQVLYKNMYL